MALGECLLHVVAFLSEAELTAAEQAQVFEREVAARHFEQLSAEAMKGVVTWDSKTQESLEDTRLGGKSLLNRLKQLGKEFILGTSWAPVIEGSTDGSIRAQPSKSLGAPLVSVPLALGTTCGRPLAIGVRFSCESGRMHEGCSVGVVTSACTNGWGVFHEISFAPMTGRCFHQYPCGLVKCATVMPLLQIGEDSEDTVEAWVQVSSDGSCRFLRRARGELQSSGLLPRATSQASEYFVSVLLIPQELEAPACASILYSGSSVPESRLNTQEAETACTAVWSFLED